MANPTDKMRASVKGGLTPKARDNLFSSSPIKKAEKPTFKADIFSERLNLPLSPAQKDLLDDLAKDFQRKRTNKTESINRNTVIRALISVLEGVSFGASDIANTEEELSDLMKRRISAPAR